MMIGIQAMFSSDSFANEANHLEGVLLLQLIIQVLYIYINK